MTTSQNEDGTKGGTEMFYVDASGKKQDAALHADMMNNPEADEKWRKRSKQGAISRGMSSADADLMYGAD